MGSIDSAKAEAMLDATEEILREEGYGVLTSRRVAERLGVKQRLVYYYFHTMDELIFETFRRLSVRELDRLRAGVSSDRPLHELWDVCINTTDARLISEFMALAYHNEGVRNEVIKFITESRKIQTSAIKKAMSKSGVSEALPPDAVAFLGSSIALALNREASLGIDRGHASVKKIIRQYFDGMEP